MSKKHFGEELRQLARRSFARAATRAGTPGRIGLFDCRCCLMIVYGIDKSARDLASVWLSLPLATDTCLSDEEIIGEGISFETFEEIARCVMEAEGIAETTLGTRVYEAFDLKHKGFVTPADLERVLVSSGRTCMARNRSHQLFDQLDELGIQKISITQLKTAFFGR